MSILFAVSVTLFVIALFGLGADIVQAVMTWWYVRRAPSLTSSLPGITILKPLAGVDDDLAANLEHFAHLEYPTYEVLLGVKNEKDPAYPLAVEAVKRWPERMRLFLQHGEPGLNPKVNQLITLEPKAKYDILLVSDSNTRTPKGYLHEIANAFEDPTVGCVTNPIVGIGERKLGSLLDNFHLGATVASGMIAAKLSPVKHDIVVGKSMALRRSALQTMGGFYAARNHLAEDYVLGLGVRKIDLRVQHCRLPVLQVSQDRSVRDFYRRHQRWCIIHRTAIMTITYLGNGMLNVTPWALAGLAVYPNRFTLLGFLFVWAMKTALDASNAKQFRPTLFGWKTPFVVLIKDLVYGAAWAYGLFIRDVDWRGNKLRVHHGSLLVPPVGALPDALPVAEAVPAYARSSSTDDRRVA